MTQTTISPAGAPNTSPKDNKGQSEVRWGSNGPRTPVFPLDPYYFESPSPPGRVSSESDSQYSHHDESSIPPLTLPPSAFFKPTPTRPTPAQIPEPFQTKLKTLASYDLLTIEDTEFISAAHKAMVKLCARLDWVNQNLSSWEKKLEDLKCSKEIETLNERVDKKIQAVEHNTRCHLARLKAIEADQHAPSPPSIRDLRASTPPQEPLPLLQAARQEQKRTRAFINANAPVPPSIEQKQVFSAKLYECLREHALWVEDQATRERKDSANGWVNLQKDGSTSKQVIRGRSNSI